jgi:hypothetical protein
MRCHTTLDKRIRFVGLAEAAMQARTFLITSTM